MLRVLLASPGITVTRMAERLNLGPSRASQELRRINARGLLAVRRAGREVRYRVAPDPLVADAAPLTESIRTALRGGGAASQAEFRRIARGFMHPRRITVVKRLMDGPCSRAALLQATGIPLPSLKRHLRVLAACRLVRGQGGYYFLLPSRHPLVRAVLDCLRRESASA